MEYFLEVLIVGLVLSADSFSAALAMGFKPHRTRDVLRFAISSGGAEALVAFSGAMLGAKVLARYAVLEQWVAFILIMAVALHMIWEGILELKENQKEKQTDSQETETSSLENKGFYGYFRILIVSLATSLDAFAVGISLGTSSRPLAPYIISIGSWAFFSTVMGMALARKVSKHFGIYFSFAGAFILILIAINLLN